MVTVGPFCKGLDLLHESILVNHKTHSWFRYQDHRLEIYSPKAKKNIL